MCLNPSDMSSLDESLKYIRQSLYYFLKEFFVGSDVDTKVVSIGQAIMSDFVFTKKKLVVTTSAKLSAKVKGKYIQTDPNLFFQRLVTIGNRITSLADIISYELTFFPTAMILDHDESYKQIQSSRCLMVLGNGQSNSR